MKGLLLLSCLLLGTVPVGAGARTDPPPPTPPGDHPRLLFTRAQLPAIRERAATPLGQEILAGLRHTYTRVARSLQDADEAALADLRQRSLGVWSGVGADCRALGLLYQVSGDPEVGATAVELFRLWLSACPADDEIEPDFVWWCGDYALAYDWLHELLTPEDRRRAQAVFSSFLGPPTLDGFDNEWYAGGPSITMRLISGANWMALCLANVSLVNLVLEGQPAHSPELLERCAEMMQGWLSEGICPQGSLFEGMSYASGFGTHFIPQFILALRLRGVDLAADTHLTRVPFWLAYETLPWGHEGFDHNKSAGTYSGGPFITFLGSEAGERGLWALHQMVLVDHGLLPDATVTLLNGLPEGRGKGPEDLPLSQWFSVRGLVFARSGWGPRDAHFAFLTNPLGAGHTHADQGSFCLAANGAYFIADSGHSAYASSAHNLVHIDGKAQAQREAGLDAFVRSVDTSAYADVVDADLRLSYERVLQGELNGPWWWLEHNPVEHADRRALFVRGVTGPLLVIADDLRQDAEEREYDWLAHTVVNNSVELDGRRFTIAERYGGKFVHTLERGCRADLVAEDVPAGTYHGWLLVRSEPSPAAWASNNLRVNGRLAPYNTTFFGRGLFREGWHWLSLKPEGDPEIELPAGELRVGLESVSGGRIALAVFTRDLTWEPGHDLPEHGGDFVVLTMDHLVQGDTPWPVGEAPRGVLQGVFLGAEPPALHLTPPRAPSTRNTLHAVQRTDHARFLALLAPHDEGDGRLVQVPDSGSGQVALVRSPQGLDVVGGVVDGGETTGELVTDAAAAVVSIAAGAPQGLPSGYALVQGSRLSHRGRSLVESTEPGVHVINDGATLVVRGPGRAVVNCRRLGATRLVINGAERALRERSDYVRVVIAPLASRWTVRVSPDGRTVTAVGDGPLPLKVHAPQAVEVVVNGVSRYFVRDAEGNVYPCLQNGPETISYPNRLAPAQLQQHLAPGAGARVVDSSAYSRAWQKQPVLRSASGEMKLDLPLVGPSRYRLALGYVTPTAAPLRLAINQDPPTDLPPPTAANQPQRAVLDDFTLTDTRARLAFTGPANWGLFLLELSPRLRPLPAELWTVIGPFPSNPDRGRSSAADLRETMTHPFPPEEKLDFDAVYAGLDGREVRWVAGDSEEGLRAAGLTAPLGQWEFAALAPQAGVNFAYPLGVRTKGLCYAVTFITSPEDRPAQLSLGCDWWATAFLNGEEVRSRRSPQSVAQDGAQFNTDTLTPAEITLREGPNTLLVKCLGGIGSNSFVAWLTDPGDLAISRTPPPGA